MEDVTKVRRFGHAWVVSGVGAADGPADVVPVDPVRRAEQRARDLLEDEDVAAARQITKDALGSSPDRPELLWLLADVEFADGDQQAAMCHMAAAVSASGSEAASVSRRIRTLAKNRLWRETLMAIEHVPPRVRDDPLVRTAVGDFFNMLNCHGHAVGGYGDRSGLSSSTMKKRRRSWLRSGGPFTFIRRRVITWEDSQLLPELRKGRHASTQLDTVPDLDSQQAHRLKVRLENCYYEWSYH